MRLQIALLTLGERSYRLGCLAAVLLRHTQGQQAHFPHFEELLARDFAGAIPMGIARRQHIAGKATDAVRDQLLFFAEAEIHADQTITTGWAIIGSEASRSTKFGSSGRMVAR